MTALRLALATLLAAGLALAPAAAPAATEALSDQCVLVASAGSGSCTFRCDPSAVSWMLGAGGPATTFQVACSSGGAHACGGPACLWDMTGDVRFAGTGTCTLQGAGTMFCGNPVGLA